MELPFGLCPPTRPEIISAMRTLPLLLLLSLLPGALLAQTAKPRVIVLTDIENEPDDAQSLVRFLTYSHMWQVEGLIATTSTHLRHRIADDRIRQIVAAYGQVEANLRLHQPDYPAASALQAVVKAGIPRYGMTGVGAEMDSEGSDWLIEVVDRDDPRPVWVLVWGGPNVLAQALWRVRHTRTEAELDRFVSRLRVYTISDQDDSGPWMRETFPGLFYIVSPGSHYRHATWSGISGEPWYHFASGADTSLVRNPWLRRHIMQDHGPLGAEYPEVEYAMEGDTPTFLYLVDNGLNQPDRPDWGGWGGRYERYQPRFLPYRHDAYERPETRPLWTDVMDEVTGLDGRIYIDNHATIWRWRTAFQHDFAARMDWCIKPYAEANHPPVPVLSGPSEVTLAVGDSLILDAAASTDPDGDALTYQWFIYPEPGTFWHWRGLHLRGASSPRLVLSLPTAIDLDRPQHTHLILAITDTGTPSLTRYQRVIVHLMPRP